MVNAHTVAPPSLPQIPSQGDQTLILAFQALDAGNYPHATTLFNEALIQGLSSPILEARALNMRATFRSVKLLLTLEGITYE